MLVDNVKRYNYVSKIRNIMEIQQDYTKIYCKNRRYTQSSTSKCAKHSATILRPSKIGCAQLKRNPRRILKKNYIFYK